jgi:hypothetical protein
MDGGTATVLQALAAVVVVIFGGAVALLVAPVAASFTRRLMRIARPDSAAADRRMQP